MTPSNIVRRGFETSPVVMMNEAHDGMSRCARTRRVGREILPAAHEAGCRHLAMEALPNPGRGPTIRDSPSVVDGGYLAQPEMRALVDAANELGWSFIAYEIGLTAMPAAFLDDPFSMKTTNQRELVQADNLLAAHQQIGGAPVLVWCGNSHNAKIGPPEWTPMAARFISVAGFEPFSIDQIMTVTFVEGSPPMIELTEELRSTLDAFGGTAGFTIDDPPCGLEVPEHVDALILSTDNEMSAG